MNILFTVKNNENWNSILDSRFGRTDSFMLYNEENDTLTWHSNDTSNALAHGAGIQTVQTVADLKTDIIITGGGIGPKAMELLKRTAIKLYTQVGEITIKEAYDNWKNKRYTETNI